MSTTSPGQSATTYRAYLLRLWREHEGASWRCSLQATDTNQRIGFADVDELVSHLVQLTSDASLCLSPDDVLSSVESGITINCPQP